MNRRRAVVGVAPKKGYVFPAVLWMIVLLTAVAFEVSRRARLERLSALNAVDDVVVTAALDASVERARSWFSDRLTRENIDDPFVDKNMTQRDHWENLSAYPTDTVRLTNVQFASAVSDAEAKLNINEADTWEIASFLSAIGFDTTEAARVANAIGSRRDGRFVGASGGTSRAKVMLCRGVVVSANATQTQVGE